MGDSVSMHYYSIKPFRQYNEEIIAKRHLLEMLLVVWQGIYPFIQF